MASLARHLTAPGCCRPACLLMDSRPQALRDTREPVQHLADVCRASLSSPLSLRHPRLRPEPSHSLGPGMSTRPASAHSHAPTSSSSPSLQPCTPGHKGTLDCGHQGHGSAALAWLSVDSGCPRGLCLPFLHPQAGLGSHQQVTTPAFPVLVLCVLCLLPPLQHTGHLPAASPGSQPGAPLLCVHTGPVLTHTAPHVGTGCSVHLR